ncbi:unnamed protein product [Arctogadus glacialis]
MKGLLFFAFLGMTAEIAAGVGITVTVFSVTSKNMIVRWTRFPDATSYKVTVAPLSTPDDPTAFAQFGPNTVMGSVGPLSPNVVYEVKVEALANQVVLNTTSVESRTAPQTVNIDNVKAQDSSTLIVAFTPVGGATGYQLRVENAQGYFSEEAVASSPALVGSLLPYTTYSVSIMAVNSAGRSQPSSSVEARTCESCGRCLIRRRRATFSSVAIRPSSRRTHMSLASTEEESMAASRTVDGMMHHGARWCRQQRADQAGDEATASSLK